MVDKARRPQSATPERAPDPVTAPVTGDDPYALAIGGHMGFARELMGMSAHAGTATGTTTATAAAAPPAGPGDYPHRDVLEPAFGVDLSQIPWGIDPALAVQGLLGLVRDGKVWFADARPNLRVAAHELTHWFQQQRHGGAVQAKEAVSAPHDAAELEADRVASRVGSGGAAPAISAAPSAVAMLEPTDPELAEAERLTKELVRLVYGLRLVPVPGRLYAFLAGIPPTRRALVKRLFASEYGTPLVSEIRAVCGPAEQDQILALDWGAMSVRERLESNVTPRRWLDLFADANEEGMLDVLRSPLLTPADRDAVRRDPEVMKLLRDSLNADEMYEALTLLATSDFVDRTDPWRQGDNTKYAAVVERITSSRGTVWNDKDAVYQAIMDLPRPIRGILWASEQATLDRVLNDKDLENVRILCLGTEAEAAAKLLELSIAWTDDEDGIRQAADLVIGLQQEYTRLQHELQTLRGVLADLGASDPDRERVEGLLASHQARLDEIGDVAGLLTPASKFLENAEGTDAEARLAVLLSPPEEGPPATPEQARERVARAIRTGNVAKYLAALYAADEATRRALLAEQGTFEDGSGGWFDTPGDRYHRRRLPGLQPKVRGGAYTSQELGIARSIAETGALPKDGILEMALSDQELVVTNGQPTELRNALTDDERLGLIRLVIDNLTAEERALYRQGMWEAVHGDAASTSDAKQAYLRLMGRLETVADRRDIPNILDDLLGAPSNDELATTEGRKRAAELLLAQVRSRRPNGALGNLVSWEDERLRQATVDFEATFLEFMSDGDVSVVELNLLRSMEREQSARREGWQGSMDAIGRAAATFAGIAAGIAVTMVFPPAAGLVATAVAGAGAGATAGVIASYAAQGNEFDAGDFQDAAIQGALNGALAGASERIAAFGVQRLAGLARGQQVATAGTAAVEISTAAAGQATVGRALATGLIDGALGEAVITAADEETWKRGAWDAVSRITGALVRGGAIGLAAGGVGHGVGRLLANSGELLADVMATARRSADEAGYRAALRAALPSEIADEMTSAVKMKVLEVDPKHDAFFETTRSRSGQAVIYVSDEGITVFVKRGAPSSVMAEEAIHLEQLLDPNLGPRIRRIYERAPSPAAWRELSPDEQLYLFTEKLDIEIDAQVRLLRRMQDEAGSADAIARAEANLTELVALRGAAEGATAADVVSGRLPWWNADQPPWLFGKQGYRSVGEVDRWNHASQPRTPVADSTAATGGRTVQRIGDEWTEGTHFKADFDGTVSIKKEADGTFITVTAPSGRTKTYAVDNGAHIAVSDGATVTNATLLATESRRYRLVEIHSPGGGAPEVRGEILQASGRWRQRGRESSMRGMIAEDAANTTVRDALAAQKAAGTVARYFEVPRPTRPSGFDGEFVVFRPKPDGSFDAEIRILEVKDYPTRSYVPYDEFSAITDNLRTNVDDLMDRLNAELAKMPPGPQRDALKAAVDGRRMRIEVHLSPDSSMAPATGPRNVLSRLRTHIDGEYGSGTFATSPVTIPQTAMDEATRRRSGP